MDGVIYTQISNEILQEIKTGRQGRSFLVSSNTLWLGGSIFVNAIATSVWIKKRKNLVNSINESYYISEVTLRSIMNTQSDKHTVKPNNQSVMSFVKLHNLPVTCQSAASRPSENTGTDNDFRHTHIRCHCRLPGLRRRPTITQAFETFHAILFFP